MDFHNDRETRPYLTPKRPEIHPTDPQGQEMQQDPHDNPPGTIPFHTILSWPNTPGQEVLDKLQPIFHDPDNPFQYHNAIANTPHMASHIIAYFERITVQAFRQEALDFYLATKQEFPEAPLLEVLRSAAHIGTTDSTIGMAIMTDDPGIPQASPTPGTPTIMFTRLSKDPQWMGMDSTLPYLRNLQAVVFQQEHEDTPTPGAVVAVPRDIDIEGDATTSFPSGLPAELDNLLAWHSAAPRIWIVQ